MAGEMTGTLKSTLRNQLKPRRNKKFVKLIKEKYPYLELDHVLPGKLGEKKPMDYLLCPKTPIEHQNKHYQGQTEEEFTADLMTALNIIFDVLDEVIK